MSQYSGVVRKIFPKSSWGTQSFVIDSVDKTYFNLGKVPPIFTEGQSISFDGREGKRAGNVDVDVNSIVINTDVVVKSEDYSMAKQGAKRTGEYVDKDVYWKNREENDKVTQKRIEIQAARNAAIAVLGPARDALEDEAYMTSLDQLTDKFLADNEKRLA